MALLRPHVQPSPPAAVVHARAGGQQSVPLPTTTPYTFAYASRVPLPGRALPYVSATPLLGEVNPT